MQNNSKLMNSEVYISSAWQQHTDLITHLCHFSQNILLVLGKEDAGKTTFFEHFVNNPGAGLKICALKADPENTVEELLKDVAMGFDLNWENADSTTKQVQAQAIASYQIAHETWTLIIDDAHLLDDMHLAALLQLVQFNDEARQQLHLVLVGESLLETRLFSPNLATWAQGKVYSIELEPWTLHDLKRYFSRESSLMPLAPEQIADIFAKTEGIPGLVVKAQHTLQDPLTTGANTMTKQNAKRWTHPIALGAVAGFLLGGSYLLFNSTQEEEAVSAPVNTAQVENNRLDTSDEKMAMEEEPAPVVSMQETDPTSLAKPTAEVTANAQIQANSQPTPVNAQLPAMPEKTALQAATVEPKAVIAEPKVAVVPKAVIEEPKVAIQEPKAVKPATVSQPKQIEKLATKPKPAAKVSEAGYVSATMTMTDAQLQETPAQTATADIAKDDVATADTPKKALSTAEEHLLSVNKKYYTLQLVGARNEKSLHQFIQKNELANQAHVYRTKLSGKDWYVVVLGEYATMDEAKTAASGIPASITAKPWIREFNSIHSDIKKQG